MAKREPRNTWYDAVPSSWSDGEPVGIVELQQAFDFVLEEMQLGALTVTDSRREVGYNKPYDLVRAPELSVGAQRLLNAVNFIGSHHPDMPHFDVDLAKIKWLANISTRDHQWIDGLAKELQQAAIEVLDPEAKGKGKEDWVRMPLLGPAGVKHGRFVFELNSVHRGILKSPNRYAFFSLTKGHKLKGEHAPILHDRLLMEVWRGETPWIQIPDFLSWFGREQTEYYKKQGFRAIRMVIIEPALKQINEHADFSAQWETQNRGRKVIAVRFTLSKRAHTASEHAISEVRSQLYDTLRSEFNLGTHDFDEITAKSDVWTEARITEIIELTRYRIEFGRKEVASPRALFLHLLRSEAVFTPMERSRYEKAKQAKVRKVVAEEATKNSLADSASKANSEIDVLLANFATLNTGQQQVLIDHFRDSPSYVMAQSFIKRSGDNTLTAQRLLDDPKLRGLFGAFLVQAQKAQDSTGR